MPGHLGRSPSGERVLGRFRVLREIGRGGMGVVYEAAEEGLDRRVALKVLEAHLTLQEEVVERFHREAEVLAQLRHPHILPVFSAGEFEGSHFFAMELVEGVSLADVIPRTGDAELDLPPSASARTIVEELRREPFITAARVVRDIASALQHAHDHHILHRDVKPSNVLLREDGSVALIDFGLSRDCQLPGLTQSGQLVGTPYYVSPEQVSSSGQPDHRVDVYAAGVVLYELLTGQRPYAARDFPLLLEEIRRGDAPPPRRLRRAVPRSLDRVCRKAMARDADERYPTAGELVLDLQRFLDGEPVLARGGWRRSVRRGRGKLALFGILVLAAVLGGVSRHPVVRAWMHPRGFLEVETTLDHLDLVLREPRGSVVAAGSPADFDRFDLAPGSYVLEARSRAREPRSYEVRVEHDQEQLQRVWLPRWAVSWEEQLGARVCAVRWADLDGDGVVEALLGTEDGTLSVLGGDGRRWWAREASAPVEFIELLRSAGGDTSLVVYRSGAEQVEWRDVEGRLLRELALPGSVTARTRAGGTGLLLATDFGRVMSLSADGVLELSISLPGSASALGYREDAEGRAVVVAALEEEVVEFEPGDDAVVELEFASGRGFVLAAADPAPRAFLLHPDGRGWVSSSAGWQGAFEFGQGRLIRAEPDGAWISIANERLLRLEESGVRGSLPFETDVRAVLPSDEPDEWWVATPHRLRRLDERGRELTAIELQMALSDVHSVDLDGDRERELMVCFEDGRVRAYDADRRRRVEFVADDVRDCMVIGEGPEARIQLRCGARRLLSFDLSGGRIWNRELPSDLMAWVVLPETSPWAGVVVGDDRGHILRIDRSGEVSTIARLGRAIEALAPGDSQRRGPALLATTTAGRLVGFASDGSIALDLSCPRGGILEWVVVDFDGDGRPESLVTTATGTSLELDASLLPRRKGSGRSRRVVAVDGDGDGRPERVSVDPEGLVEWPGAEPLAVGSRIAASIVVQRGAVEHLVVASAEGRLIELAPTGIEGRTRAFGAIVDLICVRGGSAESSHVLLTSDRGYVLLDEQLQVRARISCRGSGRARVADLDEDGQDELILVVDGRRVAVVDP